MQLTTTAMVKEFAQLPCVLFMVGAVGPLVTLATCPATSLNKEPARKTQNASICGLVIWISAGALEAPNAVQVIRAA